MSISNKLLKCLQIKKELKIEPNFEQNIPQIEELSNRMQKLELDNIFMKYQLKHQKINNSKDEVIESIKRDNYRPEQNTNINEANFGNVVVELKNKLSGVKNPKDLLKPIEV